MRNRFYLSILFLFFSYCLFAQKPEKQISFANESKPHTYYVQQAELWWNEVQKDKSSENAWYNYYRACRSAQGTDDWKQDFVKESPSLMLGADILKLMKKYIPDTFTYYFVAGSTGGVNPNAGPDLLKAYQMNPDFEGINSDVVTYAESISDLALRKKANKYWFKKNELAAGLLTYGYNVLMSVKPNSILLTQGDNDTYPLWMLQDALDIRPDVTVICIDFLIEEHYRDRIFKKLNINNMDLKYHDINHYIVNWEDIVHQFLNNIKKEHPLYIGLTVPPSLYKNYIDRLSVSGLTLMYSEKPVNNVAINKLIFENSFLLDNLKVDLISNTNQKNIDELNLNYLKCFNILYHHYQITHQAVKAKKIKELILLVSKKASDTK